MDALSEILLDFAIKEGACVAGIATIETLAGAPPSADLTYVLPEAKSAVAFAVPLDQTLILPYLTKQDRLSVERDVIHVNSRASGISLEMASYLQMRGFAAAPVLANMRYRPDAPSGIWDMYPDLSHRYLAARSGVGYLGLSGNLITPSHGAAVILGSVVTAADLTPTDPLPPEQKYCDGCGLCMASCASRFIDLHQKVSVTLGGVEFEYSQRRDYNRCGYVCGGFAGLHSSGKWSTWSPGRFPIPADDGEFLPALQKAMKRYREWLPIEGGFYSPMMKGTVRMACGHCQLICASDREERERRYRALTGSGVVIQKADGSLEAVSPEAAVQALASMPAETRRLYEEL